MATTRTHTSRSIKLNQSTGTHKLTQRRRTVKTEKTSVEASTIGHKTAAWYKNEIQTVTLPGIPTGGTFTLTLAPNTTAVIAFNANAAAVQAALVLIASIGAGNVSVTGVAGNWAIEFISDKELTRIPMITGDGTLLTGGTSLQVQVTETQIGGSLAVRPPQGGNDDLGANVREVAEAPSFNADGSTGDRTFVTGTVAVPTPPPGSEEGTRKIWRGNTFSKRIPF